MVLKLVVQDVSDESRGKTVVWLCSLILETCGSVCDDDYAALQAEYELV